MNRREFAGLVTCAVIASLPMPAPGEPAAGKPILIGAHLDQAKQASYYTLLPTPFCKRIATPAATLKIA
jgi:hypothetical protein